ncbi:putative non-ribosomal peptide synthetase [Gordonia hirsuta DSM 44140 = NBRC 16056]|uniref:Putative non-ribosomal peptide synthetase n=1 Tax=Gordonia hirsuta DSM 44140 = NBRC 16056 TaxID=1121927 RepID=L7LDS2_9ACTN|nr:non-ribosomal peptide synthetase [Gordonia hirsuta]GAC58901.1 putative non-ribosomal peptide synthetase [Gordonia hirsuta DSM 44140 = NBRC 16056]
MSETTGTVAPDAPIELSLSQAALWFGQSLDPENTTFNVCDAVELSGPIDPELLVRAAHLAVTESDALTARIVPTPAGPRQLPGDFTLAPPPVLTLADGDLWPQVYTHIRQWTGTAHDATGAPGVAHWVLRHGGRTLWVLAAHHLLIDAYGLSLVFSRGADLYRRLAVGDPDPGRPLGSIRDVVAEDRAYLDSGACADDAAFWTPQSSASAQVAAAAQARAVRTARAPLAPIENNWAAGVTAAAAAHRARRTGQLHQTLGFLAMNRLGLAAARVPTSAVNLLPLALPTPPHIQIRELIESTAAAMRELSAHQRYRGRRIEQSTLTAGFARQVGTVVNVKPFATTLDFGGTPAVVHSLDRGPVQDYSVTVAVDPTGRPEVIVDADAELYDDSALADLIAELTAFIDDFLTESGRERTLATLGLLPAAEHAAVMDLGDGGPNPAGAVTTLELFDATTARRPDDIALVAHDAVLSYAELAERSHRLADVLADHGVGPETFVAVVAEASAAAVVAIHAVWRAGGAYVPVDPRYPADRIGQQLADCTPRVVLVGEADGPAVTALLPEGTVVLDLPPVTDPAPSPAPARRQAHYPAPGSAAYAIYTSGSTGRPKGVVVSQGSLSALLGAHQQHTVLGPHRRVLSTHTLSFDSSVSYLAWMCAGHTLHLIDRADVTTADLVVDYVREHRIDFVDAVPVLLDIYVRAGIVEPAAGRHVPEALSTGGEAFPPELWSTLARRPEITVFNLYGPTEGTVDSTFARVGDSVSPAIGVPTPGGRLFVLDAHLQPVAAGRTGELYLSGPQLARGYHHQPGLTAERFVASPFGAGQRMYRTGDLVRWNDSGGLDYLGRADDQVQLAGYRVEFGEVEALVTRAAHRIGRPLAHAVADIRTGSGGTRRLVCYVSGWIGDDFGPLREEVAARAPAHLVPAVFVPVPAVPLSPAGKTDRPALPDPWADRPADLIADDGSAESVLCTLFAELLDLPAVAPDDDFFSLGGDSIIAIQVTSRARAAGLTVTPRQIFTERTARALAATAASPVSAAVAVDPAQAYGAVPPTPLMRRVLRHSRLRGFVQGRVLSVPAGATVSLLDEALTAVAAAHPILTAHLDGETLQVPAAGQDTGFESTEHHLSADPGATPGADLVVRQLTGLAERAAAQMDPAHAPLLRALLVRDLPGTPATDALILLVHHLAVDGVSWRILTEDLRTAFAQAAAARAIRLESEGSSFREWTRALAQRAESADITGTAAQWEHPGATAGEVAVAPETLDPREHTAARVERLEVELPAEVPLTRLPALYNTGPTEILLGTLAAALTAVFGRSGDRRLFVDLEGHGREEGLVPGAELSRTVGWFTAFWPVPVDLPETGGFDLAGPGAVAALDAVIKQVKERLARPEYSGLEYGLLTELGPGARPRDPSPVLFNYLGRLTSGEGHTAFSALWPDRPLLVLRDPDMPASHPLEINAVAGGTGPADVLRVELSWVTGLVGAEQISAVVTAWTAILDRLAEAAERGELGGITPSDSLIGDLTQDEIEDFAAEFT